MILQKLSVQFFEQFFQEFLEPNLKSIVDHHFDFVFCELAINLKEYLKTIKFNAFKSLSI